MEAAGTEAATAESDVVRTQVREEEIMLSRLRPVVLVSSAIGLTALGWSGSRVFGGSGHEARDAERAELARRADALEPFAHAFRRVAAFARPSVVFVEATHAFGVADLGTIPPANLPDETLRRFFMQPFRIEGSGAATKFVTTGSGVIVDASGTVLTSAHIIASPYQAARFELPEGVRIELEGGQWFSALVVGCEPRADLAVLKIVNAPGDLQSADLAGSSRVECGDWVLAVGNPFGRTQTASVGVVSAKGGDGTTAGFDDFLETDAAINPGNACGPLLDLRGETVGINVSGAFTDGGSTGVGFAIPSPRAGVLRSRLEEIAGLASATFGVSVAAFLPEKPAGITGLVVTDVAPNSAAGRARIHAGDVLVGVDGKTFDGERLRSSAGSSKKIKLAVWRDGHVSAVELDLGASVPLGAVRPEARRRPRGRDPALSQ